eukprot:CCRYP_006693-RA/>CCRYP_006693-RA protein AED:0.46 eAED:0.57 QI:0/0/0/1/0/0/2/0/300
MHHLIPRFAVPKADNKRVVWDSKVNHHNAALWAPSFILADFGDPEETVVKWLSQPVASYLLAGSPDEDYTGDANSFIKTWQADIDMGQQFHNFPSHEYDRLFLGLRMIDTHNDGVHEHHWFMRFNTLHFGGWSSPYIANQAQARIMENTLGNPESTNSEFQWSRVILNLPTMIGRDPSLPRVVRIRDDGELVSTQVRYVTSTQRRGDLMTAPFNHELIGESGRQQEIQATNHSARSMERRNHAHRHSIPSQIHHRKEYPTLRSQTVSVLQAQASRVAQIARAMNTSSHALPFTGPIPRIF